MAEETRKQWKQRPLLERLRSFEYMALDHICVEAADRIVELEGELRRIGAQECYMCHKLTTDLTYDWLCDSCRPSDRGEKDLSTETAPMVLLLSRRIAQIEAEREGMTTSGERPKAKEALITAWADAFWRSSALGTLTKNDARKKAELKYAREIEQQDKGEGE